MHATFASAVALHYKTTESPALQLFHRGVGENGIRNLTSHLALVAWQQPTIACKGNT